MPARSNILVVANRTAGSEPLVEVLAERAAREDVCFTLVVPATPGGIAWAADMDSGEDTARRRLEAAVSRYRAAGVPLRDARLGHPDPLAATLDAVHFEPFAEIVVSSPPLHLFAWLRISLPHRVAHATGLPVTHVEAPRRARAAGTRPARARHGLRTISSARG
jgi:hypothetical protein